MAGPVVHGRLVTALDPQAQAGHGFPRHTKAVVPEEVSNLAR